VVIVQHMPPLFTKMLAERLSVDTRKDVRELTDGEGVMAGRFYIAPGGHHTTIERRSIGVTARLDDRAPLHSVKPAVDYLFESAAVVFGGATLGCVLTGMGTDGALGAAAIQKAGGLIVVQDRATSAVWGMPGAVVRAGNADAVVPIDEMATALLNAIEGRRPNPREAVSHGA
jgi:two-component system chemotaxis response regulator CheB